jgi:hypothetical protein
MHDVLESSYHSNTAFIILIPTYLQLTCYPLPQNLNIFKMPRLDENTQQYLRDTEQGIKRRTVNAWNNFTDFALRDNVLEVAVGLMYAHSLSLPKFKIASCKYLTTTTQPRRLLHRLRQLPRNRHSPPPNITPPLPRTQPP